MKPWVFFRIPVPEGTTPIKVTLESTHPGKPAFTVQAGWWLWTEQPLQKSTLTLEFADALPAVTPDVLPFPTAMETRTQVLTLQALTEFSSPGPTLPPQASPPPNRSSAR